MAQHDYVIANQSGAAFRADLNNGLAAIVTLNSGATAPSTTSAYMLWADTTAGLLKMRNGANNAWITLRELDGTLVFEDGTAAAPGLAFASDLNTGIYRIGADSLGISTNGVNRFLANSSGQVAVTLAGSAATPSFTKDDDLNTGLFYPVADTLAITTGGTERARIDSSGLVSTTGNARIGNSVTQNILSFGNSLGSYLTGAPNSQEGTSFLVATAVNGAGLYPSSLQIHQNSFGTVSEVARFQEATYFRMAASTGGIQFNGDTAAANALDDYEEGTWTPNQGSGLTVVGTFSSEGRYIKVGRLVQVWGKVAGSTSVSVTANGIITSSGLPFTTLAAINICAGTATGNANETSAVFAGGGLTVLRATSALSAAVDIAFSLTYQQN